MCERFRALAAEAEEPPLSDGLGVRHVAFSVWEQIDFFFLPRRLSINAALDLSNLRQGSGRYGLKLLEKKEKSCYPQSRVPVSTMKLISFQPIHVLKGWIPLPSQQYLVIHLIHSRLRLTTAASVHFGTLGIITSCLRNTTRIDIWMSLTSLLIGFIMNGE